MSERLKRKIEFIESYWTGGEYGSDYKWNDNHGELIRCGDCKHFDGYYCHNKWWGDGHGNYTPPIKAEDGFCDWAERKDDE